MKVVLYLVVGFLIWQIVKFISRLLMLKSSKPPGSVRDHSSAKKSESEKYQHIKEAEFEDLSPKKSDKDS